MNTREKAAPFMHHLEIDQSYPTTDNYVFTQKEGLKRFKLEKVNQYGQFAEMVYHK